MTIFSHNPNTHTPFPLLTLTVQEGRCTPPNEGFGQFHWHEEVQFVLVKSGQVQVTAGGQTALLDAGDAFFINAGAIHRVAACDGAAYHSLLIPPKVLGFFPGSAMATCVQMVTEHAAIAGAPLRTTVPAAQPVLAALAAADNLCRNPSDAPLAAYRAAVAVVDLWLALMDSGLLDTSVAPTPHPDRVRAILHLIHTRYSEPLTLTAIAQAASVSRSECLRAFKAATGTSPMRYLTRVRLDAAREALKDSSARVTPLAAQVGFGSLNAFNRAFKAAFGLTPSAYQKHIQTST